MTYLSCFVTIYIIDIFFHTASPAMNIIECRLLEYPPSNVISDIRGFSEPMNQYSRNIKGDRTGSRFPVEQSLDEKFLWTPRGSHPGKEMGGKTKEKIMNTSPPKSIKKRTVLNE